MISSVVAWLQSTILRLAFKANIAAFLNWTFFQILAHSVYLILCSSIYIYMMRYTRCEEEKKGLSKKAKRWYFTLLQIETEMRTVL